MAGSTGGEGGLPKPMTLTNDICEQHDTIDDWWRGKTRHMNGNRFKAIELILTLVVAALLVIMTTTVYTFGNGPRFPYLGALTIIAVLALAGVKAVEISAIFGAFTTGLTAFADALDQPTDNDDD